MLPVKGRLVLTSFAMARAAALAGLGIAIFPEFACVDDILRKRLVALLDEWVVDVGAVWLVHGARRLPSARVRAFTLLAREHFGPEPPWVVRRG
jgi:DNA-binding transcriptional LysR family regulator